MTEQTGAQKPSLRSLRVTTIVMVSGFAIIMIAGSAFHLWTQYDSAVESTLRSARTNARTIGSQAEQTFNETFRVLEGVADVYEHERHHGDINTEGLQTLLSTKLGTLPQAVTIAIQDENGRSVAGTRTGRWANRLGVLEDLPPQDRVDQEAGPFVGDVLRYSRDSTAEDVWLLPISVNVADDDGSPLGRVLA
ncbi:MAG: PDC sensor domain-containing protein, partial [Rhodospirillaceae bacterium]